jgi:hypothetical protein
LISKSNSINEQVAIEIGSPESNCANSSIPGLCPTRSRLWMPSCAAQLQALINHLHWLDRGFHLTSKCDCLKSKVLAMICAVVIARTAGLATIKLKAISFLRNLAASFWASPTPRSVQGAI